MTETRDDFGGVVESWGTYATLWASIDNAQGKEDYETERKTARQNTLFTIRSSQAARAITPKFRVLYASDVYEIEAVYEDTKERRRGFVVLDCVQKKV